MKKPKFYSKSSFSMPLAVLLRNQYWNSIDEKYWGENINFYNHDLFYIPVMTINLWETILNEVFQNDFILMSDTIFNDAKDAIEKWDIKTKTVVYPKLLMNKEFIRKDESLWEDFQTILRIRNEIIHYKSSLYEGPAKEVARLREKKLTVYLENGSADWIMEIGTSECARFCINTIYRMINRLFEMLEKTDADIFKHNISTKDFYTEITEQQVKNRMKELSIPLDRNNNPFNHTN